VRTVLLIWRGSVRLGRHCILHVRVYQYKEVEQFKTFEFSQLVSTLQSRSVHVFG